MPIVVTTAPINTGLTSLVPDKIDPNHGVVAKKLTGISSVTVDGIDVANGALAVHTIRQTAPITPEAGIQSSFPLDDLSKISTEGRYAQGFRLDSGSLRMMWMSVRRTQESDGTGGFEIFFQAHAGSVDRYKKRMETAGAKPSTLSFYGAAPDPSSPADKSILKKDGTKWNPSGKSLLLETPGKWQVEFVPGEPEAIKGAMQIRVLGSDVDATKALNEVVAKLGLQSAFAPPDPKALERFKMLRLLWQIAPGATEKLKLKPREDLAGSADLKAAATEADAPAMLAVDAADLNNPKNAQRAKLASLLYDTSPTAFIAWAKSDSQSANGILPSPSSTDASSALLSALATAGVPKDSPLVTEALAGPVEAKSARALLTLGVLAKKTPEKATELITREVESIKLDQLHDLCAEKGISEERIANLRFDEVYPGYFTVVDPSLSSELYKDGARWLYSTGDNPERIFQMLTGGQKASLTRFQEGILIQGKSSSSDFGTGGAYSVFTRLVTEKAIETYKNKPDVSTGYSYGGSDKGWNDWGGSRPYKLVINRSILDRTDWYGYNGDNFGRTTNLKPENHGSELVKTINAKFSTSNELCFPIGNDTAYIDYVACSTEDQKKALVDLLTSKGMTEWHGKPIADFVIVAPKLMDHPDDVTLQTAVRDALVKDGFADAATAAEPVAKAAIEAALATTLGEQAKTLALEEAKTSGKTQLESNLNYSASNAAKQAVTAETDLIAALDIEGVKLKLTPAAEAAAKESAKAKIEDLTNYSTYSIDSDIKSKINALLQPAVDEVSTKLLEKLTAEIGVPADGTPETRQAIRTQLETALRGGVREAIEALVKKEGAEPARIKCEATVVSDGYSSARYDAQSAAQKAAGDAAVSLAPAGAIDALIAKVSETVKAKLQPEAQSSVTNSGASWIQSALKTKLEANASVVAIEAAKDPTLLSILETAKPKAEELAKTARDAFAAKFPQKVNAEEDAKVEATILDALGALATTTAEKIAKQVAPAEVQKQIAEAAKLAFEQVGPGIVAEALASLVGSSVRTAAEQPLRTAAQSIGSPIGDAAAKAMAEELKVSVGAKLAEAALTRVGEQLGNQYGNSAVSSKLNTALEAIMVKAAPT